MEQRQVITAGISVAVAGLAMTTAAMAPSLHAKPQPVRLSSLRVAGLPGYQVRDVNGSEIGHVLAVETDSRGRTRYVRVELSDGEQVRIAAFRAFMTGGQQAIDLAVPIDAVLNDPGAVSDQPGPAVSVAAVEPPKNAPPKLPARRLAEPKS